MQSAWDAAQRTSSNTAAASSSRLPAYMNHAKNVVYVDLCGTMADNQ